MRKLVILCGLIAFAGATPASADGLWDWLHSHHHHHCDPHDLHHCL